MRFRHLLAPTGLALCLSTLACADGHTSSNQPNVNSVQTPSPEVGNVRTPANNGGSTPLPSKVEPGQLIDKITTLQRRHVRDSVGVQAGQCFTDNDLNRFKTDKTADKIVDDLEKDKDFLAIVESIKGMNPGERAALLERALQTYRKTWSELGLSPATASAEELRKGQTEAGQEAERSIAEAVVNLVKEKI